MNTTSKVLTWCNTYQVPAANVADCSLMSTEWIQDAGFMSNNSSYPIYAKKSEDGKTIYWYSTQNGFQLNTTDYIYYGVALF